MKKLLAINLTICFLLISNFSISQNLFAVPQIQFAPKSYICYQIEEGLIIDGRINDSDWLKATWTDSFIDIEGPKKANPPLRTRVKMLWDADYFYFAAELEEPHLWATLTERDAVIYYDNDFEIFIDPDGNTHDYYEYEVNALGTVWDLLLQMPYRDQNTAINAWDIQGLKSSVALQGTLNDNRDTDTSWTIEVAIPWKVLAERANRPAPPKQGDQWRVNFSRVQWQIEKDGNSYKKAINEKTGRSFPENNWVWSPQGLIAMHYPEMWGYVQFSDKTVLKKGETFVPDELNELKWILRRIYYAQKEYHSQHKKFASDINDLHINNIQYDSVAWPPVLQTTDHLWEASLHNKSRREKWIIRHDGKIWPEQEQK